MRRRWISVLSGGVAATMLAGLGALVMPTIAGAIPNDGRIYGCYSQSGGALRVVDVGTACRKNEMPLSWSQEGSGSSTSNSSLWYTTQNYQPGDPGTDLSQSQSPLLVMTLPDLASGEGYLLTATFTLVNKSASDIATAADAGVTCNLGNLMGITDLMVLADGISPEMTALDAGGIYSSNRRSFTLTGISDFNQARLECAIGSWTGLRDMPTITFAGGYMTAQKVSVTSMPNEATP